MMGWLIACGVWAMGLLYFGYFIHTTYSLCAEFAQEWLRYARDAAWRHNMMRDTLNEESCRILTESVEFAVKRALIWEHRIPKVLRKRYMR